MTDINPPCRQAAAEVAGLHGNAARCVPVFAAYLATLMHTYSLARKQARRPACGSAVSLRLPSMRTSSVCRHLRACLPMCAAPARPLILNS